MVKLPAVLLRGIKPSAGSGLESPNSTHTAVVVVLNAAVLEATDEILSPRIVATVLRRTPIVVTSKTANSNSVYIQLV